MLNIHDPNDVTNYTIYLKNEGATAKNFWCFLQKPKTEFNEGVYANSSAQISVLPNYGGVNNFTIPLQYVVGVGASNQAVELGVQIDSSFVRNTQLESVWNAKYATIPPQQGPTLELAQGLKSDPNTISLVTNNFNATRNLAGDWHSSMSFGIQSANGFIGITWKPSPGEKYQFAPNFSFYIATGEFSNNHLADILEISRNAAEVDLEQFSDSLEATVTLTSTGEWRVTPGKA
jgi:hypothetical protein